MFCDIVNSDNIWYCSKRITVDDGEKVEVIGGADKYMAVCRGCFHNIGVRVAASPRCPLKTKNSSEAGEDGVSPVKKMLFSSEKENSDTTASAV